MYFCDAALYHYSSLQCQKSFSYADLMLKKHLLLVSILKTVALINILVENMISFFFRIIFFNRKFKRTAFIFIYL